MSARNVRVAVAGSVDCFAGRVGLGACALDVVAELPEIGDLLRAPSHEHQVAIVACTAMQLGDPRFHAQLARLARDVPTVLVVPQITRRAATVAAQARVPGLLRRDARPEDLARAVRDVVHGRIAYPPEALAVLLRLLPRATGHHGSLRPTT